MEVLWSEWRSGQSYLSYLVRDVIGLLEEWTIPSPLSLQRGTIQDSIELEENLIVMGSSRMGPGELALVYQRKDSLNTFWVRHYQQGQIVSDQMEYSLKKRIYSLMVRPINNGLIIRHDGPYWKYNFFTRTGIMSDLPIPKFRYTIHTTCAVSNFSDIRCSDFTYEVRLYLKTPGDQIQVLYTISLPDHDRFYLYERNGLTYYSLQIKDTLYFYE